MQTSNLLADFFILSDLLDVEQVVEAGLIVVSGEGFVHDRLGEELIGRQRDLISGQKTAFQLHVLIRDKLNNGFTQRVPALGRHQKLLPRLHQMLQIYGIMGNRK